MKNFVKLIQQAHKENFSAVMNRILTQKIPVAFMSLAPNVQAVELVKNLRAQGLNVTNLFVIDSTPPPTAIDFNVIHVSNAAKIYPQPEYILTLTAGIDFDSRFAQKNFPNSTVINIGKKNADTVYETFMTHLDELREVYESLIDEESRKTFRGYWLGNISGQRKHFVHSKENHYLINGFIPERGAVVIEAGAFDGGTATILAEMGYKVYTFEMDKLNFDRTKKVAAEKNFVVENLGLGSYKHTAHYNVTGTGANKLIGKGADLVKVTTVDAYVREKNLSRVDMIKLDVEGAELDVLKGAVTTIARFKPILALSAYHKWNDFWTLMNFVKSVRPDYEFALRHSYDSPEDVPHNFSESLINYLIFLDLEVDARGGGECVLFAR